MLPTVRRALWWITSKSAPSFETCWQFGYVRGLPSKRRNHRRCKSEALKIIENDDNMEWQCHDPDGYDGEGYRSGVG